MRTVILGLALCVTCLAVQTPKVEVVVPPSAAHPQDWLSPQIKTNPNPNNPGKPVGSLGDFVAPEVISRIVVDEYAGPPDDVRQYLVAMPTAAAQNFGTSLKLCKARFNANSGWVLGARLDWTSTSTVTFASGRTGKIAVATVVVSRANGPKEVFGLSDPPDCVGFDKVPVDSLYVSYIDPDGFSWAFAVPLQSKK